ncbi:unnamed protein product [Scytosiphon promiscuus]
MLPFKRCRLMASPATGLVGMRENVFLSDFFGCMGFLPLSSQSEIRRTIVKILILDAPQQEPALSTGCCGEGEQSETLLGWGTFGNASRIPQLPEDPSFATFWSTVALGALAKGCPFDAVESYSELARDALTATYSASANAELAKASAILTYVYSCMCDMFREYLQLSETFLQASIEQGSTDIPAGFRDVVLRYRKVGNVQHGPIDSSWAQEDRPPQLEKVVAEGEPYRFIAQSIRAFDEAVHAKARERCAGDLERFCFSGPSHWESHPKDDLPSQVSEAVAAVLGTSSELDFEPLREISDRPSIRAGIGDLLINGPLVFGSAAKGDIGATLENLDRSIVVYERYPGLCRCMMTSHMPHKFLALLSEIGDLRARRMYGRLQGTLNSCRAPHTPLVPPLDEWQGMSAICDDLHCRAMEAFVKTERVKAFTTPSVDSIPNGAGVTHRSGQSASEIPSTGVAHGEIKKFVHACSYSSWTVSDATSNCPQNAGSALHVYPTEPLVVPPASRIHPSSQPDTRFENAAIFYPVTTKALGPLPRSADSSTHREGSVEQEHDGIAAADWLEVAQAMLDTINA